MPINREGVEARRERESALLAQGWRSTGDVPYMLQRRLGRTSGTLVSRITELVEKIVERESEEFAAANVELVGRKRYISPTLIEFVYNEAKLLKTR